MTGVPLERGQDQGTESLNNENWDSTLNGYRFGADFRVNKKTTLGYTQLLQYYDGGQTYSLNTFDRRAVQTVPPVKTVGAWCGSCHGNSGGCRGPPIDRQLVETLGLIGIRTRSYTAPPKTCIATVARRHILR